MVPETVTDLVVLTTKVVMIYIGECYTSTVNSVSRNVRYLEGVWKDEGEIRLARNLEASSTAFIVRPAWGIASPNALRIANL